MHMDTTKTIQNQQYLKLIVDLRTERERLGLTQIEIARSLNMTQSEISKIETAERRLDILELKKLLKVYRITENKKLKQLIYDFF